MSQGMYISAVIHLRTKDFFGEKLNMKALEWFSMFCSRGLYVLLSTPGSIFETRENSRISGRLFILSFVCAKFYHMLCGELYIQRKLESSSPISTIGGFHVTSSPRCWWTVDKRSLISDLLFTVHQHGGDDVTWKPPISWRLSQN